ncbi:hypothetical protein [Coleofasciculus sp. FACHB-1120]|uniref:hypothetical protein n=1 Tax=Coleofasciculus sp. FACHB-1120 TaxID=2692783 RepID=UPI001F54DB55|nr:hypothetical protein [Coleofasciculus sp. FACHB-1120]
MTIDHAKKRPEFTCALLPFRALKATIAEIGAIAPAMMWSKSIIKKTELAKELP